MTDSVRQKQICIVEPNPVALENLAALLKASKYASLDFGDPDRFLSELPELEPDLVLAEWDFRGMDGEWFCRQIVEMKAQVPVLFLSESLDPQNRLKALAAGALDFLGKPYDRQVLQAKIAAVLRVTASKAHPPHHSPPSGQEVRRDFVAYLRELGAVQITPVPDPDSGFGYSYPDVLKWQEDLTAPADQTAFLDDLANQGHLYKEIHDSIRSCARCSAIKLNIRQVCPHCKAPLLSSANGRGHCHRCQAPAGSGLLSALCLACSAELDEAEIRTTYIHIYRLGNKTDPPLPEKDRPSLLARVVADQGLQLFGSDLLTEFLRLEERQHRAAAKTFAILLLRFRRSALTDSDKDAGAQLGHVMLVLKKYLRGRDTLFEQGPDQLLVFLAYIDVKQAQERAAKLSEILGRLKLASLVEVNLSTYDPAHIKEKADSLSVN